MASRQRTSREWAITHLAATDPSARATAATIIGRMPQRWPAGTTAQLCAVAINDSAEIARAAAYAALIRKAHPTRATEMWRRAAIDQAIQVRIVAARMATHLRTPVPIQTLVDLANDPDGLVAEAACFCLGELVGTDPGHDTTLVHTTLTNAATNHHDPLVRESAVAALGSIGHPDALPTILGACADKPAVRRRAVLALASYEGPEVDAAITRALTDRDWQVRQAAEDLTDNRG